MESTKTITIKSLIEAGVHLGHKRESWNPRMEPYIFAERKGICVIDPEKTIELLNRACEEVKKIASEGKKVLFVGTKRQFADGVKEEAIRCGAFYCVHRWLGGTLSRRHLYYLGFVFLHPIDSSLRIIGSSYHPIRFCCFALWGNISQLIPGEKIQVSLDFSPHWICQLQTGQQETKNCKCKFGNNHREYYHRIVTHHFPIFELDSRHHRINRRYYLADFSYSGRVDSILSAVDTISVIGCGIIPGEIGNVPKLGNLLRGHGDRSADLRWGDPGQIFTSVPYI